MSIKDTKERIIALLDDEDLLKYTAPESFDVGFAGFNSTGLKALARSHTHLLTALNKYLAPHSNDAQTELAYNELLAAKEEGEG